MDTRARRWRMYFTLGEGRGKDRLTFFSSGKEDCGDKFLFLEGKKRLIMMIKLRKLTEVHDV